MNENLIHKCPECKEWNVKDRPILHLKLCSLNNLEHELWETENNKRYTRLFNALNLQCINDHKISKLNYKQLAEYLVENIGGNLDINSLESAVIDRIYDILLNLYNKKENKENDRIDNLA